MTLPGRPRRRIFHSHWWTLGWHSKFHPERSHVTWSFMPGAIHRLSIHGAWNDNEGRWFSIDWGDTGSNPVWSIGYQWADPPLPPLSDDEWRDFEAAR